MIYPEQLILISYKNIKLKKKIEIKRASNMEGML
jgi:hypothetical protein